MRNIPDVAQAEIETLRADNVELTDNDIIWLASLGERVENPKGCTKEAAGLQGSIRLSDGTALKPLTLRAENWLTEVGQHFNNRGELFAVAYASANPERLDITAAPKQIVKIVKRWGYKLKVTKDELETAVNRLVSDDAPADENPPEGTDTEDLLGMLVAATGLPREHWEMQTWDEIDRTHAGLVRYACMVSGNEFDPDTQTSKMALRDLALAVKEIRNRA